MNEKELEKLMEDLLENTKERINRAYYGTNDAETRLIFPKKRDNTTRVSEQELRFAFVEAFNETYPTIKEKLYYAVEVPTRDLYKFNEGEPKAGEGRSGNIDLVIYDETGPRVLIEFKSNNPTDKNYKKDFCKLDNEKEYKGHTTAIRYFIEVLEATNEGTINSLSEKCKDHPGIHFKFLDLNSGDYLTEVEL